MLNLNNIKVSYFIMSSKQIDAIKTLLWAKEWDILPLKGIYENITVDSILVSKDDVDNMELKKEALFILKIFKEESCIIKYKGKKSSNKLFHDNKESDLSEALFNQESKNKSYLYNGSFFSFNEVKSFKIIESKEELKNGMVVEYFNNKDWISISIFDINTEWDNFYRLLVKYNKVRIVN